MRPFAACVIQDIGSEKPELVVYDRSGSRLPRPGWESGGA